MPFTVEDFRDLIRLLEERPEWCVELRSLLLTPGLLALPDQIAVFKAETDQRFRELVEAQQRTEAQVAALAEAQRRTEAQVAALAEAQRRAEARLAKVEEHTGRLEAALARLAEAQERFTKTRR
jgi:chromosome segregation ATPase